MCIRKRPLSIKELNSKIFDCISIENPNVKVLVPKLKVDGITQYIDE